MQRDLFLCRKCLTSGIITTDKLSVHHIVPLSEDFSRRLDDDNLITLCDRCHREVETALSMRAALHRLAKAEPRLP